MVSTVQVTEFLHGIDLPKDKSGLVQFAQSKHAPQEVIDLLNRLPDQQYSNMTDITHEIDKME